ncbi:iron complex transport system permease protein [Silvimonas terrae]|uniref:Iron complex transport system permease protein n=1 Tax=Silvimonas terrae TaxID=300266 RepID=A0A840RN08_9NEIS|nr:iron ABC transporter permease [Silvimonas terrae]MBB5193572.1 iron complex transport system permease protein [Silvimonas terrae]
MRSVTNTKPMLALRQPAIALPCLLLALVLVVLLLAASISGAVDIPWTALPRALFATPVTPDEQLWQSVLRDVRLPRVIFAALCGAGLAVAGAAMQALFRNPLAEPGLVGISAGGALGAVAAIVGGASAFGLVAGAAFAGSLLALFAAWQIGRRSRAVAGLLLAGVAINAICGSLTALCTWQATDAQLRSLTFWNLGSLAGGNWSLLAFLAPWTLLLSALLLREWRGLNALLLGEREAGHLGFAIRALQRRLIVLVALLVGPLVAACGTIAFVGLVVPHIVRLTLGARHQLLLPASWLVGAIALVLADWVARRLAIPAEIPVGIVTSLAGGPFFLWLLARWSRA